VGRKREIFSRRRDEFFRGKKATSRTTVTTKISARKELKALIDTGVGIDRKTSRTSSATLRWKGCSWLGKNYEGEGSGKKSWV